MCTENLKEFCGEKVAWKVVYEKTSGKVVSPFYSSFRWAKGENIAYLSPGFHCFARRSDARDFKKEEKKLQELNRNSNKAKARMIRVVVSRAVFTGKIRGIGVNFQDKPAICGMVANWDGKFVS